MIINFRHGLISGPVNALTRQLAFLAGRSSTVNIIAPTPILFAVAHGATNYLVSVEQNVTPAWSGFGTAAFPSDVDYYLYIDIHPTTGMITYGQTKYDLLARPTAPSAPSASQHWFDTTNFRTKVWSGTAWVEKIRVFVAKYANRSTIEYKPVGSQIGIVNVEVVTGKIVYDGFGRPVRKSSGEFFTTEDQIYINGTMMSPNSLETRVLTVMAMEAIPANSVVRIAEFDKVRLADYEYTDSAQLAFARQSAVADSALDVITSGVIEVTSWNWPTVNAHVWVNRNGTLTTTDPGAQVGSDRGTQYPVGRVIGTNTIRFNPTMVGNPLGGVKATPLSIADTIVQRDSNASFAANVISATDFNTTSDIRCKKEIQPIVDGLEILHKLTPVRFTWILGNLLSYGLIAQDVEEIVPELVITRENGTKGVSYIPLIAMLIQAVQTLDTRVIAQSKLIELLNNTDI